MSDDDRKITITFEYGEDGSETVKTWLKGDISIELLLHGFMKSLVSILRTNDITDEEIPDYVREYLRAAMLGVSLLEPE